MYYKILMDGVIVDALHDPVYVRWQERNGIFIVARDIAKACGIVSSDGSAIYHITGMSEIPVEGYATADMAEVSEEKYLTLRQQLDEGQQIIEPETPEEDAEETQEQQVLTLTSLHARLTAAESEVAGLTAAIEKGLSL